VALVMMLFCCVDQKPDCLTSLRSLVGALQQKAAWDYDTSGNQRSARPVSDASAIKKALNINQDIEMHLLT